MIALDRPMTAARRAATRNGSRPASRYGAPVASAAGQLVHHGVGTRLIRSGETSTSFISRRWARTSGVVMPRADSVMIGSLNPASRGLALGDGPWLEGRCPGLRHR